MSKPKNNSYKTGSPTPNRSIWKECRLWWQIIVEVFSIITMFILIDSSFNPPFLASVAIWVAIFGLVLILGVAIYASTKIGDGSKPDIDYNNSDGMGSSLPMSHGKWRQWLKTIALVTVMTLVAAGMIVAMVFGVFYVDLRPLQTFTVWFSFWSLGYMWLIIAKTIFRIRIRGGE